MSRLSSWRYLALLGGVVALFDFFSKWATVCYLPLRTGYLAPHIPLFEGFLGGIDADITHAVNMGAAWGIFSSYPQALFIFRLFFIAALIGYTIFQAEVRHRLPLVLVISGAISNVIDACLYGHVIDMIHFRFWGYEYPVFNIADSAICIGAAWMFFALLFEKKAT